MRGLGLRMLRVRRQGFKVILLMIQILHYLKDPKVWARFRV